MDHLLIDEDGEMNVLKGKDPEKDSDILEMVNDGEMIVVRYRGNQFERMIVDLTEAEEEDEDEPKAADYDIAWEPIEETK